MLCGGTRKGDSNWGCWDAKIPFNRTEWFSNKWSDNLNSDNHPTTTSNWSYKKKRKVLTKLMKRSFTGAATAAAAAIIFRSNQSSTSSKSIHDPGHVTRVELGPQDRVGSRLRHSGNERRPEQDPQLVFKLFTWKFGLGWVVEGNIVPKMLLI